MSSFLEGHCHFTCHRCLDAGGLVIVVESKEAAKIKPAGHRERTATAYRGAGGLL